MYRLIWKYYVLYICANFCLNENIPIYRFSVKCGVNVSVSLRLPQSRSDMCERGQLECQVQQALCHPFFYTLPATLLLGVVVIWWRVSVSTSTTAHLMCEQTPLSAVFRDPTIKSHFSVLLLSLYQGWLGARGWSVALFAFKLHWSLISYPSHQHMNLCHCVRQYQYIGVWDSVFGDFKPIQRFTALPEHVTQFLRLMMKMTWGQ